MRRNHPRSWGWVEKYVVRDVPLRNACARSGSWTTFYLIAGRSSIGPANVASHFCASLRSGTRSGLTPPYLANSQGCTVVAANFSGSKSEASCTGEFGAGTAKRGTTTGRSRATARPIARIRAARPGGRVQSGVETAELILSARGVAPDHRRMTAWTRTRNAPQARRQSHGYASLAAWYDGGRRRGRSWRSNLRRPVTPTR